MRCAITKYTTYASAYNEGVGSKPARMNAWPAM